MPPSRRHPVALDAGLASLLEGVAAVAPRTVALDEAADTLVLGEPLLAPASVPATGIALRAGYAVAAADLVGASAYAGVALNPPPPHVAAGDPMPAGTDCVLPEDALAHMPGGPAEALEAFPPGHGCRREGSDFVADAIVARAGERLDPVRLAIARAAGIRSASVRQPTLGLMPAGETDACSAALLTALARRRGAVVTLLPLGGAAALKARGLDLLIVLGDPDETRGRVAKAGGRVLADALALRPGEDGALARLGRVPCVLAPDRLADALALALAVVFPVLDHLAAAAPLPAPASRLTRKVASAIGIAEIALLRSGRAGLEPLAVADLPLSAIATADRWALIPPDYEGYAPGDEIGTWGLGQ